MLPMLRKLLDKELPSKYVRTKELLKRNISVSIYLLVLETHLEKRPDSNDL